MYRVARFHFMKLANYYCTLGEHLMAHVGQVIILYAYLILDLKGITIIGLNKS